MQLRWAKGAQGGENVELIYARLSHPNAEILEDQVVPLEPGATASAVFNSGMAAISTMFFTLCPPGKSFVYTTPLYGGTYHLIHHLLEPFGIHGVPVLAGDTAGLKKAIETTENLRLVFIETPANPILTMTDIGQPPRRPRRHAGSPLVVVDNTFLGPTFQHPMTHGADIVVYSATKYLSGFSDLLGGIVLATDIDLMAQMRGIRAILGNILQPDECWMLDATADGVITNEPQSQRAAHGDAGHIRGFEGAFCNADGGYKSNESRRLMPFPVPFSLVERRKAALTSWHSQDSKNTVSLGGIETLVCRPRRRAHQK